MSGKDSKEAILDATERVLAANGYAKLSLDAIAAEAGMSKGGLFYHFHNKLDLIKSLILRYNERFTEAVRRQAETLPDSPGRWLRGYVIARREHHFGCERVNPVHFFSALEEDGIRDLLAELKRKHLQWLASGGLPEDLVLTVVLAIEGMWHVDLLDGTALRPEVKIQVTQRLLRMIEDAERGQLR